MPRFFLPGLLRRGLLPLLFSTAFTGGAPQASGAAEPRFPTAVGVARVDITPQLPIRLSGYGNRTEETNEVRKPLHVRALALGSAKPVLVLSVEVVGLNEEFVEAVAGELGRRHGLERAQIAVCVTHTHTGPAIAGVLDWIFEGPIPPEHRERVARYTEWLRARVIEAGSAAMADRKPAAMTWAEGKAGFAMQRRKVVDGKWTGFGAVPAGTADHALPVLRAADAANQARAVWLSYACHCTTLTGADNFVHPDWAGEAAEQIEREHPGSVALVTIGCGADANPFPRGSLEAVAAHAREIATEVRRVMTGPMRPLPAPTAWRFGRVALPFDHGATREELRARVEAKTSRRDAFAAEQMLRGLDAGKSLPTEIVLPVQAWRFGEELAMVFLGGEVVADYGLRLRGEAGPRRLWVNAYANGVPAYVASKRVIAEGGYEVDGSMSYYGWPTRLRDDAEDRIVAQVRGLLPEVFSER